MNPFLVGGILGHASLDMTRRYTHFGMSAKREAVSRMLEADPVLRAVVGGHFVEIQGEHRHHGAHGYQQRHAGDELIRGSEERPQDQSALSARFAHGLP